MPSENCKNNTFSNVQREMWWILRKMSIFIHVELNCYLVIDFAG